MSKSPAELYEEKWYLPEKLRADLDTRESKKLLETANALQAELAAANAGAFLAATPSSKLRARATILAREYDEIGVENLTAEQREEFAEALAAVGLYIYAAAITKNEDRLNAYKRIASAIAIDDGIDCGHGTRNKTAEAEVFSIKHAADVVLLRCTVCQDVNAVPAPRFLQEARSRRQAIRSKYSGLHPLEAKKQMEVDGITPTA